MVEVLALYDLQSQEAILLLGGEFELRLSNLLAVKLRTELGSVVDDSYQA